MRWTASPLRTACALARITLPILWLLAPSGCERAAPAGDSPAPPPTARALAGIPPAASADASASHELHNVFRVTPDLFSGSAPHNDADFAELRRIGIKTVISVDGATPNVSAARRFHLRYVHLPVGYHGIDAKRQLELARAVRDLPGAVYIHCHHGKHRGPAAAASAAVALSRMTPADAVAFLGRAGTSPSYPGLYRCVETLTAADAATLDAAPADFPEITPLPDFVHAMSQAQDALDHLTEIRDAGWRAPARHPDLVPIAEAGRLENLLRGLRDGPNYKKRPPDFSELLERGQRAAAELENSLARQAGNNELSQRLEAVELTCRGCHEVYRNHR